MADNQRPHHRHLYSTVTMASPIEITSGSDDDSPSRQGPSLETNEDLMAFVKEIYDEVERRHCEEKATALRQALLESRDAVLSSVPTTTLRYYPRRLPTNGEATSIEDLLDCQPCHGNTTTPGEEGVIEVLSESEPDEVPSSFLPINPTVSVKLRGPKTNKMLTATLLSIPIEGTHDPLPSSNTTIYLKGHYATEDEQDLSYVPYFGDDDKEDVVSELYNTERREIMMEVGPEYKERDTNHLIDQTLHAIQQRLGKSASGRLQKRIQNALASILKTEHLSHRCYPKESSPEKKSPTSPYLAAVDSYRECFCRRCFVYDCNMHTNLVKPDIQLQGELAVHKWKVDEEQETEAMLKRGTSSFSSENTGTQLVTLSNQNLAANVARVNERNADMTELTPFQKSICEHSFLIHQGDVSKMAITMGAPPRLVEAFVKEQGFSLKEFQYVNPKKRKIGKNDKTMRRYNLAWLKRVEDAEIHPFFVPCNHVGLCNEENCSCVQNAFFCTKHCVWGEEGPNFFRGCACKGGRCRTKSCPCYAAKRECDPDLCLTCGACTDPPNQPATGQRCRNDSIGMRRHCHLLLAKSTIEDAGWGIYTKHALKKGDFVHEYVGEVISQEEAERRGTIYDKVNQSYLFNLCSDFVVDASRKGNKMRFANHSTKPNCETKMIWVNGEIRIGLFAIVDIEPQTEVGVLFVSYDACIGTILIHSSLCSCMVQALFQLSI